MTAEDSDELSKCIICKGEYLVEDVMDGICTDCLASSDLEELMEGLLDYFLPADEEIGE